jgi:ABC-2 type transport system permease protein
VFDRQNGFLREMQVAPARRSAVIVGKCLGGATSATMQGIIMLLLAPLVHIPYAWLLVVVMAEMVLTALMVTALGLFVASRMEEVESFQVIIQLLVLPVFFLSGALFPLRRLPPWLAALTRLDPLSYAVDPMRRAIFTSIHAPPASVRSLNPGISWGAWRVPTLVELGVVAAFGAAVLAVAIVRFSRPD